MQNSESFESSSPLISIEKNHFRFGSTGTVDIEILEVTGIPQEEVRISWVFDRYRCLVIGSISKKNAYPNHRPLRSIKQQIQKFPCFSFNMKLEKKKISKIFPYLNVVGSDQFMNIWLRIRGAKIMWIRIPFGRMSDSPSIL